VICLPISLRATIRKENGKYNRLCRMVENRGIFLGNAFPSENIKKLACISHSAGTFKLIIKMEIFLIKLINYSLKVLISS
jgi:hypothetical protein